MGNLVIGIQKLVEAIRLPITIGKWHYSRIRVIGNVVDLITEPRKKNTLQLLFIKNKNVFITQNTILLVTQNTASKSC